MAWVLLSHFHSDCPLEPWPWDDDCSRKAGTVVGPIIGGSFANSSATWRWGFYLNLVVGGVFAPVYLFRLPSFVPQPDASISARLRSFDALGTALQAALLACGIVAINFGGTVYAWNSGQIISLFVVSGALIPVFVFQQKFVVLTSLSNRLFPLQFLRMKEPMLLAVLMAANNAATFVLMYYLPLHFQFIKGVGSLKSGAMLLPLIIPITGTIMINGGVMSKTGHYQAWYVFGSVLVLIGAVLFCKSTSFSNMWISPSGASQEVSLTVRYQPDRINLSTPNKTIYGYEVLTGIGLGCYLQSGYAVIQGVLGPAHMAYAVTFMLLGKLPLALSVVRA